MRKAFISKTGTQLSIRRQAKLVGVNRNRLTPVPRKWTEEELEISLAMDKLHMKRPYYGSRRIHKELEAMGLEAEPWPSPTLDEAHGLDRGLPEAQDIDPITREQGLSVPFAWFGD